MSELAAHLEAVVRGVPGVVTLYSADVAAARIARQLVSGTPSLVHIGGSEAAPVISVSVAVDATVQAPITAAQVAEAIRTSLPDGVDAEISVRISRVT